MDVLARLTKEKELLNDIPEDYLIQADSHIQAVRRLLALKRVNPEQISVLGRSQIHDNEDEVESLVGNQSLDDNGNLKVDNG